MPITIQEIIASDTISQLVDKTNFNFDQLLLNGGGPAGPIGPKGPTGPAGGRGPKGSTWYEDTSIVTPGVTPVAVPPTPTPLPGDFYLQFNGDVWEYVGTVWLQTTINLEGPIGPAGPPGGFGLEFGTNPIATNKNTLYNGQIGTLTTGANTTNEGVPTIMMGGVSSLFFNPDAAMQALLTDSYVLPVALEQVLSSDIASVMIHQPYTTSKSIIFHGGGDGTALTGNYEQATLASLSNITLGADDRLILDVPKAAAAALVSMNDLIGFEVTASNRSSLHAVGQQVRFVTGGDLATYGVANENSNFEVEVGTGSAASANKFLVTTLSSNKQTRMEMGGNIVLSSGQITNPGDLQFLNGDTRFDITNNGSATGEFRVNAQGAINLSTNVANASATAGISLLTDGGLMRLQTGIGGIDILTNNSDINILQNNSLPSSTSNIVISNKSVNNVGTGGNTVIESNCAIILKKQNQNVFDAPSIALNMDGGGVPPPLPPNAAHIAFVGDQTWQSASLGSFTIPLPNVVIFNNVEGILDTENRIFNQTGSTTYTDWEPGATMQRWVAGTGGTTTEPAGAISVRFGNELSPDGPIPSIYYINTTPDSVGMYEPSFDNALGISIANSTGNGTEFFAASQQKISIAAPLVFKRAPSRNAPGNNDPRAISPAEVNAPNQIMTSNYNNFGFDWRTGQIPNAATPLTSGLMPTTKQLGELPYIVFRVGLGVGTVQSMPLYFPSGSGYTGVPYEGFDVSFNFPVGAYPGQKILFTVENYSIDGYVIADQGDPPLSPSIRAKVYGTARVNIPTYRIYDSNTNAWSDWWETGTQATNSPITPSDGSRGYTQMKSTTTSAEAANGIVKTTTIEMIWDGTIVDSYGKYQAATGMGQPNYKNIKSQRGWSMSFAIPTERSKNIF